MMDTNAKGAFLMIRETLPAMLKRQKGVIINVSSVAANKGLKNRMGYSASKGAMLSMGRSIAVEYADKGIRCNTICPGTIFTPSLQHRIDNAPDPGKEREDFYNRQPIGRLGTSEEVAEVILLASEDGASFLTGAVIPIDGGMTA